MSDNKQDGKPYASIPEPLRTIALEAHYALHTVWTKNAHQVGYDKADWRRLNDAIDTLIRAANK